MYQAAQHCVGEESQQKHLIVLSASPSSTLHRMASHKIKPCHRMRDDGGKILWGIILFSMRSNSCTEQRSTVLAKNPNRSMLLGSAHAVPQDAGWRRWQQLRVGLQTPRCKWSTWNPMPVQHLHSRMRVSAWAPCYLRVETDLRHLVCGKREFRLKLSKCWRITGASNTFATFPWSKHGSHIQHHF
jgi:hypothetical protein